MNRLYLLPIVVLWSAFACCAAEQEKETSFDSDKWNGTATDWKVEARLEKREYQLGKEIPLHLTTRNITKTAKRLVSTYAFADYALEIKNAAGVIVPFTDLVGKLRGPTQAYTLHSPRVEPGAEWKSTLDLTQYFQLNKPGDYIIFVRRYYSPKAMDSGGKGVPKEQSSEATSVVFTLTP